MRWVRSRWRRISRGTTTSKASAPGGALQHARARPPRWRPPPRPRTVAQDDLVDPVDARVTAAVEGGQGDEHRLVHVAGADGRGLAARAGAALQNAHHLVVVARDEHPLAPRVAEREEGARHLRPEHGHALAVLQVEVGEEPAAGRGEPSARAYSGLVPTSTASSVRLPISTESGSSRTGATATTPGTTWTRASASRRRRPADREPGPLARAR